MTNAGFFRGTSAEQDFRFSNKQNKSRKEFKFPPLDTTKINVESFKPWILDRIKEVLENEDDLMSDAILEFFSEKQVDGSAVSEFILGFADVEKTSKFMQEVWSKLTEVKEEVNLNNNTVPEKVVLDNEINLQPTTSNTLENSSSLQRDEALALLEPFIKKARHMSEDHKDHTDHKEHGDRQDFRDHQDHNDHRYDQNKSDHHYNHHRRHHKREKHKSSRRSDRESRSESSRSHRHKHKKDKKSKKHKHSRD